MAKYTNSYLLADKHLKGGMYDFLMDCIDKRLSNGEIVLVLHDMGHDTTHETVRAWLGLLIDKVA